MEWISVKDRLPEPNQDVLAIHSEGIIDINFLDHYTGFLFENLYGEITHWMPLPEPPEEYR